MSRLRGLGIALLPALALSVLAVAVYFKNCYEVYPLRVLAYLPLILIGILPVILLILWRGLPFWRQLPIARRREILLIPLALAPFAAWLITLPSPVMLAPHTFVIQPADNASVEIHLLTDLNRRPIPTSAFQMTSDWQIEDGVIFTNGAPGSRLTVQGNLAGGLVVGLRYFPEGGFVTLTWDGVERAINLEARDSSILKTVLSDFTPQSIASRPFLALEKFVLMALELAGIYVLIFLCMAAIFIFARGERAYPIVSVVIMIALFSGFLFLKTSSLKTDVPRTFRDTYAYIQAASLAITNPQFWAGTRSFGLPLFLKLLGTTPQNYDSLEQMRLIFFVQAIFSAISWTAFAVMAAAVTSRRWLTRVLLFGLILFFSLSLEIGLWDALLLSESFTLSLFALVLASWLALIAWLPKIQQAWLRWVVLAGTLFVTVLYTFTRDSNIYFIIIAAGVLLLFWLRGLLKARRSEVVVFTAAIALLFIGQNLSMSAGNRWQIFMYDHLAVRFLNSPDATEFFAREGLPVSDRLMETRHMVGYVYQPLFTEDPAFQPVRDWVATRSKAAYLKYLISNPKKTLLDPLINAPKLLWGGNLEYRSPVGGVVPATSQVSWLTTLIYQRRPLALVILFLTSLAGIYLFWRDSNPLWVMMVLLLVSLYPMMFIIWHGEPLEIERHAVQLGIQFRLTGWLGLVEIVSVGIGRVLDKEARSQNPTFQRTQKQQNSV